MGPNSVTLWCRHVGSWWYGSIPRHIWEKTDVFLKYWVVGFSGVYWFVFGKNSCLLAAGSCMGGLCGGRMQSAGWKAWDHTGMWCVQGPIAPGRLILTWWNAGSQLWWLPSQVNTPANTICGFLISRAVLARIVCWFMEMASVSKEGVVEKLTIVRKKKKATQSQWVSQNMSFKDIPWYIPPFLLDCDQDLAPFRRPTRLQETLEPLPSNFCWETHPPGTMQVPAEALDLQNWWFGSSVKVTFFFLIT